MSTDTTRAQYARAHLALPSDGATRARLSTALARWASTQVAAAADCRGDPVSAARRLAVADAATLLPAGLDGATLVLSVAGGRAVVVTEPCTVADRP